VIGLVSGRADQTKSRPVLDRNVPAMRAASAAPSFVISLDFELRWGSHNRLGLDMNAYRANLEGVRVVVPELLRLFAERDLRVTWATVGAIGCRNWDEYFARAPRPPCYRDRSQGVNPRYADLDPEGRLHFAPELIERICHTPGQELGTHTFSHLPLREPGVTGEDLAADLAAVARLWTDRYGGSPRSLVFPRNQVAFLDVVRAADIRIWRGNPTTWYYDANEAATNGARARLLRLLDDTNPWSHHAFPIEGGMTRASLFLRADLGAAAWRLHVAHIRRGLDRLRAGEIFHLWWHPHNLGIDIRRRLERVREVLDLAAERIARGALVSQNMGELS
jgi:peptidoglycan/xylan/chitin deacetylase (PgdA/CDA1 family)